MTASSPAQAAATLRVPADVDGVRRVMIPLALPDIRDSGAMHHALRAEIGQNASDRLPVGDVRRRPRHPEHAVPGLAQPLGPPPRRGTPPPPLPLSAYRHTLLLSARRRPLRAYSRTPPRTIRALTYRPVSLTARISYVTELKITTVVSA